MIDQARLRAVFNEAADLQGRERSAYLDGACRDEPELRARVEALLAAAEREGEFLSSPTDDAGDMQTLETPVPGTEPQASARFHEAPVAEAPGARIGPYKLLQQIGEGGFGTVFMAEQTEPVRRMVALKIIKLGMDTRQVVARFEQERQALAMMDHPNVAKVLDAGATPTGRPYFVMELCKGDSITKYCDTHNLDVRERLELFAQVCNAVQHAHQKGLIHRDIKPGNVLVSTQDGRPQARIIDFGIAKATGARLTEKTLFTEHRQFIGTPEYMSPEQAEGSLDIDTRTDVYSLGVLLYELLTGATPFDSKSLRSAAYAEIQRIIREIDPPNPSTRLSQNADALASVAARRRTEPRKLGMIIRGELDWIVMKALEKDRSRRYETATGLGTDIQRYLAGEAVVAAPASRAYRMRKFVRRNKGPVTAAAAVAAALLIGAVGFAWQAHRAGVQRDMAVAAQRAELEQRLEADAQRDRATAAESEASQRAAQLQEVAEFQASMLSSIDVYSAGLELMGDVRDRFVSALEKDGLDDGELASRVAIFRRDLDAVNASDTAAGMIDRTILKPAVEAVDAQFADQPVVAASLRHTLSVVYTALGRYEDAHALVRSALETRRSALGDDHDDTLLSMNNLGDILHRMGRPGEAEAMHRETLERRKRAFGDEHEETLTTMMNLGSLLRAQGRPDEAEPFVMTALEARRRLLGDEHRTTLIAMNNAGFLRIDQGRIDEAEPYWREAYETGRRVFGADDPDVVVWTNNMGGLVGYLGRREESERYYREAYEANRVRYGESHPNTLTAKHNVGTAVFQQGRYAEAEAMHRETLAARRATLGEHHPDTLASASSLGASLQQQGRFADAERLAQESLDALRDIMGESHPTTLIAMTNLASLRKNMGDAQGAEALYRGILDLSASVWSQDHTDRLITMNNLGSLLLQDGRSEEAEPYIVGVVEARRRVSGDSHPDTAIALVNLSRLYENQERFAEAEAAIQEAYATLRTVLGPRHPNALQAGALMAGLLSKMERNDEAVPLLRESLEGFEATLGPEHARTVQVRYALGRVLAEMDQFDEAEALLLEAARVYAQSQVPSAARDYRRTIEILAPMYERWHGVAPDAGHDASAAQWRAALEAQPQDSP